MFRRACAIAQQYTMPVVLSRRTVDGVCSSVINSFVVINQQGWAVTAAHIVRQLEQLIVEGKASQAAQKRRAVIEGDASLSRKQRQSALKAIPIPRPDATDRWSAWWGRDGIGVAECHILDAADLAIVRFERFPPDWIPRYPVFKNPQREFEPGTSLCKLGFPFHSIVPEYDATRARFELPPGSLPMPMFPLDGILTRIISLGYPDQDDATGAIPVKFVETSSPGLRGQSGGPTFDVEGTVWAIQVQTANMPLGFDPPVAGANNRLREHQFLNVGWGVHSQTVLTFLNQFGIQYETSDY